MSKLTAKQARFVEEYLIDLNATQAANRAGYSQKTAAEMGYENLKKPQIAEKIAEAMAKRSEDTGVDASWLLKRFQLEAEADLADLYNADTGALKPIHEWPLIWRQGLVQGIDIDVETLEGQEIGAVAKIKLSDRVKRLELIGRHIDVQAFKDRVEMEHTGDHDKMMEEALRRAEQADRTKRLH